MVQIKQNLAWILMGLSIIGASAFWFLIVSGLTVQVKSGKAQSGQVKFEAKTISVLTNELEKLKKGLARHAKDSQNIRNQKFAARARAYREELKKRQDALRAVWEKRQFKVDRNTDFKRPETVGGKTQWVLDPAPEDGILFRGWMVRQYELRNKILADLDCLLPFDSRTGLDHKKLGDSDHALQVNDPNRQQQIIEKLFISRTLFEILAGIGVQVDDPQPDGDQVKLRYVDEITLFSFRDELSALIRKKGDPRGQRGSPSVFNVWPAPYRSHTFTLEFKAHSSIVYKFLRALNEQALLKEDQEGEGVETERGRRRPMVIEPIHLHIAQIDQKKIVRGGGPGRVGKRRNEEANRLRNTLFHEAPVQVLFVGRVLEFQFDKDTLETFDEKQAIDKMKLEKGARRR